MTASDDGDRLQLAAHSPGQHGHGGRWSLLAKASLSPPQPWPDLCAVEVPMNDASSLVLSGGR